MYPQDSIVSSIIVSAVLHWYTIWTNTVKWLVFITLHVYTLKNPFFMKFETKTSKYYLSFVKQSVRFQTPNIYIFVFLTYPKILGFPVSVAINVFVFTFYGFLFFLFHSKWKQMDKPSPLWLAWTWKTIHFWEVCPFWKRILKKADSEITITQLSGYFSFPILFFSVNIFLSNLLSLFCMLCRQLRRW